MEPEFKIGDKVFVIPDREHVDRNGGKETCGGCYCGYTAFFKENGLDDLRNAYYSGSVYKGIYTIVGIGKHYAFKNTIIYVLMDDNGIVYLMDNCLKELYVVDSNVGPSFTVGDIIKIHYKDGLYKVYGVNNPKREVTVRGGRKYFFYEISKLKIYT